ncbi:MAG: class I SAM-dependent methyltransferase, partial [Candidatus Binatia bacterium]
ILQGVPILLRDVPPEWSRQTETKARFARRPRWRRRLLNPDLTTKGHQQRRLRDFLSAMGSEAVLMDVGSSLRRLSRDILCFDLIPTPGVDLVGDLHAIPLADGALDAVVCNGVLEHVEDPERVVRELRRVLKEGGRAYVSIPFLQGYHPSPTDYRRFTRDGARKLMSAFRIDEVVNTRGSASTVTWILTAFLAELFSFNRPRLYALGLAFFGWMLLPLKYLDYLLIHNRFDHYATSGFTVIGTKKSSPDETARASS